MFNDLERRMKGAIDALKTEFTGLRTGRANPAMLDPVVVNAYGAQSPLNQVSNITAADARMLSVQVWDAGLVASVEKAIRDSGLGLNPMTEGQTLRIPIPEPTEERRRDMTKVAAKYAESARVAIRNVRRDGMDVVKKQEKDSDISKDESKSLQDKVQKLTDTFIAEVDELLSQKEKDIMSV